MKKVTGIGGVFFKSNDPKKLKEWYHKHLGIESEQWGTSFNWLDKDDPQKMGTTVWSPFKGDTDYFDPSNKAFMINYRVDNLLALLEELKKEGVTIIGEVQEFEYGKFAWIVDPEGTKIELWEPVDEKL